MLEIAVEAQFACMLALQTGAKLIENVKRALTHSVACQARFFKEVELQVRTENGTRRVKMELSELSKARTVVVQTYGKSGSIA